MIHNFLCLYSLIHSVIEEVEMRKTITRSRFWLTLVAVVCVGTSVVTLGAGEPIPVDMKYAHGNAVQITDIEDFLSGKVTGEILDDVDWGHGSGYYGGSNQIDVATTNLEITKNLIKNNEAYRGGGFNKDVGTTNVIINAPFQNEWVETKEHPDQKTSWWMFGGGYGNDATTTTSNIVMNSGWVKGYLIGGGQNGSTTGNTNIIMNGGYLGPATYDKDGQGEIYGGGVNESKVTGNTNITINGGNIQQHIVGGGLGAGSDVMGSTNITINGGTMKGTIAGGGGNQYNTVYGDSNITIKNGDTDIDGGINSRTVTGGGYFTTNIVKGTANILIDLGNDESFKANVYGSGGIKASGNVLNEVGAVNLQIRSGLLDGNVFAGGSQGIVLGESKIILDGGNVSGNIYGGSYLKGYANQTDITLKNGTVSKDVYGIGGSMNLAALASNGGSNIHIYPTAQVNGRIVASNTKDKVTAAKETRVIFHDMDTQDGFLTTFADKEIETGTSVDTAMEFNNFTANNTTTIANTDSRFAKIDFTNNTNMYLTDVVNQYFGNYWTIDTSSRVYINEAQTIDAVDVLNKGTIALLKGEEGKEFKELMLTGTYTGEDGNLEVSSKAVGSTDYVNIAGVATGSTALHVDLSDGTWDGNDLDLVEADMSESDANAFTMEPFACVLDKDGKAVQAMAKLLTRTDEETGRRYWYLSYTEAPEVSLQGTKEIKGIDSTKEEFTFEVVQVDEQGIVVDGATPQRVTRTGAGEFTFNLEQYNEGTYYFQVKEAAGKATGWTYDDKAYLVKVTVTYDVQNDTYITVYENAEDIRFVNTYTKKEEPKNPDEPDNSQTGKNEQNPSIAPDTGDRTNVTYMGALLMLSACSVWILSRKKRSYQEH